ncbi:MAG: ribosomal-protein-alanine N-acetyltransferase [Halothiobacillus sp. 24-54-40]|jgi:ribosomal-protein-alanine N-acetyltransferase|nr:MAG: ribosomal-protein-alanine N-acetyltransferase [Halothiobacillus sp. 35-54-62]OYZ88284.1 MAG: ribosomal-protein-alanine N-acetyltransferase [Halothiobacillus sp. 24-54-40]OZA81304.1 MAG: ribosomal-protein-alanine N-acetyltransferase [Halothiobacillus sp. 39-53-45]HQS01954.1 ribosomal protein S18-alanine N-acetyltransferase [Halothiobacillus sp.]HQS28782.1 ribosomal protein S18-alanine N-acetyltransferase [Halothiobacillus sp.]
MTQARQPRVSEPAPRGASIRILGLDEEDLPAIEQIEHRAHLYPWSNRVFQDCIRSGYLLDGAFDGQNLRGFSVVMPILSEWHVLNLCVDPPLQRQGVGRSLLRFIIEQAHQSKIQSLWLEVRVSNAPARALYAAHGFAQVGLRKAYYPAKNGREDALVLTCEL